MLTGACPGDVFTSPNAVEVRAATSAADAGAGVVHIVKNDTGDVLNFRIGAHMCAEDGVDVEHVLVADDVATDTGDDDGPGRRGTAATIAVEKICGAAAERGDDLATVAELGRRVAEGARSMAVALGPCTLPGTERPSFDLPEGRIEFGIGIHGERGIAIARPLVGGFVTSLDRAGASVTLVRADDDALAGAARAATGGAESTAGITASRGRASYVGEVARGLTDPGALVIAWLFEEAAASR